MLTTQAREAIAPRLVRVKPVHAQIDPSCYYTDRVCVKFRDGTKIRLRDGLLTDLGDGRLNGVERLLDSLAATGATWQRRHSVPEEQLAQLCRTAEGNLRKAVADLNTTFLLRLPAGLDAATVIDQFNALPQVEIARPVRLPAPLPTPPDLEPNQGYLDTATAGVDAEYLWTVPGGTGHGVRIADTFTNRMRVRSWDGAQVAIGR